jgi:hypothetical protein
MSYPRIGAARRILRAGALTLGNALDVEPTTAESPRQRRGSSARPLGSRHETGAVLRICTTF